jgi:hypothetical protein
VGDVLPFAAIACSLCGHASRDRHEFAFEHGAPVCALCVAAAEELLRAYERMGLHPPEPYLSRAEIARFMAVCDRTIDRWTKEGCPHETWGLRAKKFRASEVQAWARRR